MSTLQRTFRFNCVGGYDIKVRNVEFVSRVRSNHDTSQRPCYGRLSPEASDQEIWGSEHVENLCRMTFDAVNVLCLAEMAGVACALPNTTATKYRPCPLRRVPYNDDSVGPFETASTCTHVMCNSEEIMLPCNDLRRSGSRSTWNKVSEIHLVYSGYLSRLLSRFRKSKR